MVRASSAGARQIMEEWLATRYPAIAEGLRAAQALFGPGDWIGFQGEGDGELRALLVAQLGAWHASPSTVRGRPDVKANDQAKPPAGDWLAE